MVRIIHRVLFPPFEEQATPVQEFRLHRHRCAHPISRIFQLRSHSSVFLYCLFAEVLRLVLARFYLRFPLVELQEKKQLEHW